MIPCLAGEPVKSWLGPIANTLVRPADEIPFGKRENLSAQAIDIAASTYPYFASGLDGENFPSKTINLPHLFRKNLYPNRWELELELQSVFQRVDRWKGLLRRRQRADSLQRRRQATPAAASPTGELSSACTKDN